MARYLFNLPTVQATQTVRLDTASGSDSPASGLLTADGTAITATLTADHIGFLPEVQGPDGVATLYLKVLTYGGAVTGTPVTLTGYSQDLPHAAPSAPGGSSPVGVGDFTRWEHDGVADATSGNFDFVADQLATAGTSISVDDSADWITNWGVPVPQVTVDGLYTIVHYADATANTVGSIDIQFVDADTNNIDGTPIPPTVAPFVATGVEAQAVYTLTEWLAAGTHIIVDLNTGPGTLNQERLLIRKVG